MTDDSTEHPICDELTDVDPAWVDAFLARILRADPHSIIW